MWGSEPEATLTSWVGQAPLDPLAWATETAGPAPLPHLFSVPSLTTPDPFFFQILGGVILGFGVWILADRSSFISVLRKDPCFPGPTCPGRQGWPTGPRAPELPVTFPADRWPCPVLPLTAAGVPGGISLPPRTKRLLSGEHWGVGRLLLPSWPLPSALTLRTPLTFSTGRSATCGQRSLPSAARRDGAKPGMAGCRVYAWHCLGGPGTGPEKEGTRYNFCCACSQA